MQQISELLFELRDARLLAAQIPRQLGRALETGGQGLHLSLTDSQDSQFVLPLKRRQLFAMLFKTFCVRQIPAGVQQPILFQVFQVLSIHSLSYRSRRVDGCCDQCRVCRTCEP